MPILGFLLYQAPKDFSPTITLNEPLNNGYFHHCLKQRCQMEESDHHEIYVNCRCQLKTGAKTEVNAHEREFIFLDLEQRDTHPPFNKGLHSAVSAISQHACLAQMPISKGILNCHASNLYYSNHIITNTDHSHFSKAFVSLLNPCQE